MAVTGSSVAPLMTLPLCSARMPFKSITVAVIVWVDFMFGCGLDVGIIYCRGVTVLVAVHVVLHPLISFCNGYFFVAARSSVAGF